MTQMARMTSWASALQDSHVYTSAVDVDDRYASTVDVGDGYTSGAEVEELEVPPHTATEDAGASRSLAPSAG